MRFIRRLSRFLQIKEGKHDLRGPVAPPTGIGSYNFQKLVYSPQRDLAVADSTSTSRKQVALAREQLHDPPYAGRLALKELILVVPTLYFQCGAVAKSLANSPLGNFGLQFLQASVNSEGANVSF